MFLAAAMLLATSICPVGGKDGCGLEDAHLNAQQRTEIAHFVDRQEEWDGLWLLEEHLGTGASTEVIVQEGCNAQNCSLWIFALKGGHAVLLLKDGEADRNSTENYRRLKTVHHGMHDFVTIGFVGSPSDYESIYTHYEFDGTRYSPTSCRSSTTKDDNGKGEVWAGPPHPCQR